MRSVVGMFGIVCGAVVIWTVGNYGYASADDPAARWNIAFLFGVIAAGGLFGHAVSVRLWPITGCGPCWEDRAELARLQKVLDRLGAYVATDKAAVDAAQRAADAATTAKERECGNGDPKQRGRFCRDKEDAEREATLALAKATAARALTDRAIKLEVQMQPIRERLLNAGPIVDANVQGTAIAKLFRLPDAEAEFAATVQQFALAGVVEALIVLSMVAFELLGRSVPRQNPSPEARTGLRARMLQWWRRRRPDAWTMPHAAAVVPEKPRNPQPLKLVAVRSEGPVGLIPKILIAALESAAGDRVEMADVYRRYNLDCTAAGNAAVSAEQFADPLARFCKGAGIRTKVDGNHVYLLNVRLSAALADRRQARSEEGLASISRGP